MTRPRPSARVPGRRAVLTGTLGLLAAGAAACTGSGGADEDVLTIGCIPAWTDTVSMAHLLRHQLEEFGHTVELESFHDAAIAFTALAQGDIDLYSSAWPDVTHARFMDRYGEQLEDLATYSSSATTMLAVPDYSDLTSIEDLAADPGRLGGRIVGIEPGAGLTTVVEETVMPRYGLEADYELVTSSTTAMMTELRTAIDEQAEIAVSLWSPSLADRTFAVRPLEDPAGAFAESESMHVLGRAGFAADHDRAAAQIGRIQLTDAQYRDLEDAVIAEADRGGQDAAVAAWVEENPSALAGAET